MRKRILNFTLAIFLFLMAMGFIVYNKFKEVPTYSLNALVVSKNDKQVGLLDDNATLYTFETDFDLKLGDDVVITYDANNIILDYEVLSPVINSNDIPDDYLDDGLFSQFYLLAYEKLLTLSLEEKVGQLFLVHYDEQSKADLKNYFFSGFVFYEKDFANKNTQEVQQMIQSLQDEASIALLTAVDEEGGSVIRVSSNSLLVSEPFKSSSELYLSGGMQAIKEDVAYKSEILDNLGLNLNLAPVVDVATSSKDYIYQRSLKQNTQITSVYATTVISASKSTNVSYALKHFPGYASNADTHVSSSTDTRSYQDILTNDIPPFTAGIEAGAEAILVSHNIVDAIDSAMPSSLSISTHNLLRDNLGYSGVIISDDISMAAVSSINNVALLAVEAGNNLIITADYEQAIEDVLTAIENKTISEELINRLVFKTLAWKYYKGLMYDDK